MLREFLCLQTLLGRLLIIAPMLAIFLVPLGLGVNSVWAWCPWWALAAVPLALMVIALLWIKLSLFEMVPPGATPWALTPTYLWLDRFCLDASTPETVQAGVDSFSRFLGNCDRMVAFVSPDYFKSLW